MKTVSFKVPEEVKEDIKRAAKEHKMSMSRWLSLVVEGALKKGSIATTMYDSDTELASKIISVFKKQGVHMPAGGVNADFKRDTLIFSPEAWYMSLKHLIKEVGVPENVIIKTSLGEYAVVYDDEGAVKAFNNHTVGNYSSFADVTWKLFKEQRADGVVLVKKIDPLQLSSFCKTHSDKKVVCIFNKK